MRGLTPCDAIAVTVLGAQAGTPLYTMASWHVFMGRRHEAWLLRRLGAFSVYREGLDRTAIRTAIELLVEARRPLVIFPEGIITRSNDRLARRDYGTDSKTCAPWEVLRGLPADSQREPWQSWGQAGVRPGRRYPA